MTEAGDPRRMWRLLDVARSLVDEPNPEVVYDKILEAARELTGARYAALGVLNEARTELESLHTAGMDEQTRHVIGQLPRGRGVLGLLVASPQPLRIDDVGRDGASYGFPPGHPAMTSFLGVPVQLRGEVWGNLYLTNKDGAFDESDEEVALIAADWAATAIELERSHSAPLRRWQDPAEAGERDSCRLPAQFESALLDAAPDGILLVDADGRIVFTNRALQELFDYDAGELNGQPIELLVPESYRPRHVRYRQVYAAAPEPRPMGLGMQLQGRRRDGSEFPVEISLAPLRSDDETYTVSIVRDATEQRLREQQRLHYARSQAVEEIVAGLEAIVWEGEAPDRESMTYLGGREEAFLGYTPGEWMQPGFWLSVVHPDDRVTALTFVEAAREQETFELEYRLIDSVGAVHHVRDVISVRRDEHGEIERLSGVIIDMTERRELELRIAQAQKMEAIGQLAGGIAHDFNNLLTIVAGYARRLQMREDLGDARGDLDQIVTATDRAAELTRQLLSFARRGMSEPEKLDVNASIRALEPMLRRLIEADIAFDFELDPDAPVVMLDRTEFEQILMNLILNASDAMRAGGTLTIATHLHRAPATEPAGTPRGADLRLTIADTGIGIAPEVRERLFEPFFTTKGDRGTGMGLATVYGIVTQAGGWIDVDSAPGVGTTFEIMLPAAVGAPTAATTDAGSEGTTVLLVEDEDALRKLAAKVLEDAGYSVLQAANGLDAVTTAERHRGPIDLLVTDVVMPRLSGPELAQRLRGLRPGLEVLFMSGYNDSRLVSRGVEQANINLLVKPFTPDQLAERVHELTSEH